MLTCTHTNTLKTTTARVMNVPETKQRAFGGRLMEVLRLFLRKWHLNRGMKMGEKASQLSGSTRRCPRPSNIKRGAEHIPKPFLRLGFESP